MKSDDSEVLESKTTMSEQGTSALMIACSSEWRSMSQLWNTRVLWQWRAAFSQ